MSTEPTGNIQYPGKMLKYPDQVKGAGPAWVHDCFPGCPGMPKRMPLAVTGGQPGGIPPAGLQPQLEKTVLLKNWPNERLRPSDIYIPSFKIGQQAALHFAVTSGLRNDLIMQRLVTTDMALRNMRSTRECH